MRFETYPRGYRRQTWLRWVDALTVLVVMLMTERGVSAMLAPSLRLGADASITAGPVGGGAAASTANISAGILIRRAVTNLTAEPLLTEISRLATGK